MSSEEKYCDDYCKQRPEEYEQEVIVGALVCRKSKLVNIDEASGLLAVQVDALHTPCDVAHERLVECKKSVGFRGLGQLLLYRYLRYRDRDLVREKSNGEDESRTYRPKPSLEDIKPVLAVGELSERDLLWLSAYTNLEITVEHRTSGNWQSLDSGVFEVDNPEARHLTSDWLKRNSRASLSSSAEEEFLEEVLDSGFFGDSTCFREVPVGKYLYSSGQSPLRIDAVFRNGDYWFIVEIKKSSNKRATTDFERAFGQSVGYANLFAREWGIPRNRVAPIVLQAPVALIGGVYREDRYGDDFGKMRSAAFDTQMQPMIIGGSQRFG